MANDRIETELHAYEVASVALYDTEERRVTIVTDSDQGRAEATKIADQIGARVLFSGSIAGGERKISDIVVGDIVFVDISRDCDAALDIFLDDLDRVGRAQRVPILVNVAPECLDAVSARLTTPTVTLMSQATAIDWISALALFGTARDIAFHEVASDDSLRLQRLADEVERIARTLADLAGTSPLPLRGVSDAATGFRAAPVALRADPPPVSAAEVRAIIRLRRMRERFFRSDLFADPAWDMLLDLMAARLERIRVAVSSLCIAAAVPPTTALRWIKTMTDNGMFVRVADDEDGRRVFIELSEATASGMSAYLSAAKAQGGLAV